MTSQSLLSSMKAKNTNVEVALQQLADNGYDINRDNLHTLVNSAHATAWYQHVLLAIGVFAAFICFLLVLAVSDFYELSRVAQSIGGAFAIGIAIVLHRTTIDIKKNKEHLSDVFVMQISLVLLAAGKGLVLYHLSQYLGLNSYWQMMLLVAAITVITFPLYSVKLSRIVSLAILLLAVQYALVEFSVYIMGYDEYQMFFVANIVLFIILTGLVFLSFSTRYKSWSYLRYALIMVAIFSLNIAPDVFNDISRALSLDGYFLSLHYSSYMTALALCGCVVFLTGKDHVFYGTWLLCAALLVLAYFLPVALFFALLIIVLGHANYDKVMSGFGVIMMVYYLFKYYYDLQMSLLDKSLLLMISGVLLLFTAVIIHKITLPATSSQETSS